MKSTYSKNLRLLVVLFLLFPIKLGYYIYCFSGPYVVMENFKRVEIVDAENRLLATSMQTYSVYYIPYEVNEDYEKIAVDLSKILNVDSAKIYQRLLINHKFVWIERHISPEKANKVSSLGYSGIYITKDCIRFYPCGDLFFHVLGKVDDENQGLIGVEKYYNDYLNNEKNERLKLSLKSSFQHVLKDELIKSKKKFKASSVSGMIVCARTGKILSMFSKNDNRSFLNPHIRDHRSELNLAVQARYELGSILKVLSASMFLEYGLVTPSTILKVPPFYLIGSHKVQDYGKRHLDTIFLTFKEAFVVSSNVAFLSLANDNLDLSDQKAFYSNLGLFDDFYIDNIFVKGALFPSRMRRCDISVLSYGYGVSLSIASYMLGFLRLISGKKLNLHIEENYIPSFSELEPSISNVTVLNLRSLLYDAVAKYESKYNFNGVKVGGKTGTSKKHSSSGYSQNGNLSSFIFAYPINDPEVIGIIFIDDPKLQNMALYGYESAMVVALSIVERLIKL